MAAKGKSQKMVNAGKLSWKNREGWRKGSDGHYHKVSKKKKK
jgi:hypothetical protein